MREGVCFATKATANIWRDYTNMRRGQFQDFAQFAMDIMRCLGGRPEGNFASDWITWIGLPTGNTGVGLHRSVVVTLVIEPILANVVSSCKPSFDVAKIVRYGFVDV